MTDQEIEIEIHADPNFVDVYIFEQPRVNYGHTLTP
jgi:hypothetical protein